MSSGLWNVSEGGTGQITLATGKVLIGNGTNAVDITKSAPTGAFVGDTDIQTLTNKTINGATIATPTISGANIGTSTITGTTFSGTISTLTAPLSIANGGLGIGTVSNSSFLSTDGSGIIGTTILVSSIAVSTTGTLAFTRIASSPFSGTALNTVANYAQVGKILAISLPLTQAVFGGTAASSFSFDAVASGFRPQVDISGRLIASIGSGSQQFGSYLFAATGVLTINLDSGSYNTGSLNGFFGFAICFPVA